MGTTPTTVNPVASFVNGILQNLMKDGQATAEAAIIADVPWLGLPVVKQLLEVALNFIGGYLYKQAAYAATQIIVDTQANMEASATFPAFQNLQMAVASGDQGAITQAESDMDKAYASLIHYDGSAPP